MRAWGGTTGAGTTGATDWELVQTTSSSSVSGWLTASVSGWLTASRSGCRSGGCWLTRTRFAPRDLERARAVFVDRDRDLERAVGAAVAIGSLASMARRDRDLERTGRTAGEGRYRGGAGHTGSRPLITRILVILRAGDGVPLSGGSCGRRSRIAEAGRCSSGCCTATSGVTSAVIPARDRFERLRAGISKRTVRWRGLRVGRRLIW